MWKSDRDVTRRADLWMEPDARRDTVRWTIALFDE
jgi:hypothetical protein